MPKQRIYIVEGKDFRRVCSVDANPPISSIGWHKYNPFENPIQSDSNRSLKSNNRISKFVSTGSILEFFSIKIDASGNYTCWATNSEGTSTSSPLEIFVGSMQINVHYYRTIFTL